MKSLMVWLKATKYFNYRNPKRYMSGEYRCDAHMNELPIPCMPWDDYYKYKQSNYNKVLAFGLLWHIFSLSMAFYTGSLNVELWRCPAQPGPPSDMVEECEDA